MTSHAYPSRSLTDIVQDDHLNYPYHWQVVAGSGAVQGRPPVRVLSVHVAAEVDEEPHDVEVACADRVVQSCDAFVVSRGRIFDAFSGGLHQVELSLQRRVQKQGQWIETHVTIMATNAFSAL